ncbi:hypothetical protein [Bacillus weihaiensis]|uniref:Uncharacterized protein n=1 Tax=Bacillus weihaiensis TaxID=1547283 RepID=A0A1L3MWW8_9BACI|nr:hypothetical protein [Bacillus weihaiensis]APH06826.1 hypothetical protein A9C19_20310 [Bacillus weihaiensis]
MKNFLVIALIILLSVIIIATRLFQVEYKTLEDLEKLFNKHNITYTSKPIEDEYLLDIAKEQRIYEVEENDIYVYIVDKADLEKADYRVSNEILGNNFIVTTSSSSFIFAYTEKNLEKFEGDLFSVINEIIESEK